MIATFLILLPVFGLIVAGYACRMLGVLGPTSATELNKFVVWLALPALQRAGFTFILPEEMAR